MVDHFNWAHNVKISASDMATPTSVGEVSEAVASSSSSRSEIKAFGGSWSFTDIMATSDRLVNTQKLRGILAFSQGEEVWGHAIPGTTWDASTVESSVLPGKLRTEVIDRQRKLVHVLSGTTIRDLYLALGSPAGEGYRDEHGTILHTGDNRPGRGEWMLPTKVGLSGQSIAGAISTSSHGGDFNMPPLADFVRAIEVVGQGGLVHWIEPEGAEAITDPARMRADPPSGATAESIHYDNELFNAALVAVGSLGIIASLVLEAQDQFGISEVGIPTTWRDIRPLVQNGEIFTTTRFSRDDPSRRWIDLHPDAVDRSPRGMGLAINPYRISDDYSEDDPNPDREVRFYTQAASSRIEGDHHWPDVDPVSFLGVVGGFESGDLGVTRAAIGEFLRLWSPLTGTEGHYRRSYTVWDSYSIWKNASFPHQNYFFSMEIAVNTANGLHVRLMDRILEICDEIHGDTQVRRTGIKLAAGIFMRFTRPSKALLSMQHSQLEPVEIPGRKVRRGDSRVVDGTPPSLETERFCHIEILVARELRLDELVDRAISGRSFEGHSANMENYSEIFMARIEEAAHEFGARMHWGQLHRLSHLDVERDYPKTIGRFRRALTKLAWEDGGTIFKGDASRRMGLVSNMKSIAVVKETPNCMHHFTYDSAGNVKYAVWEIGGAFNWTHLGNGFPGGERFVGPLTAVSMHPGRYDVFGLGKKGGLLQLSIDRTTPDGTFQWVDLSDYLGTLTSLQGPISAVSAAPGRLDIFGLTEQSDVQWISFTREGWRSVQAPNGLRGGDRLFGAISAVVSAGRVNLFGLDRVGRIVRVHVLFDRTWGWETLDFPEGHQPKFTGSPVALNILDDVELFVPGRRRTLYTIKLNGRMSIDRIPGAFERQLCVFGTENDFVDNPQEDNLFTSSSPEVTEWIPGHLTGVSVENGAYLFGVGEKGALLMMRRNAPLSRAWEFFDVDSLPARAPEAYHPAILEGPFAGRDLSNGYYRYSIAEGCDFRSAVMNNIDLEGAVLRGSILSGVPMTSARMFGANLEGVDAHGATLNYAELAHILAKGANFTGIHAPYVNFSASNLWGCNFYGSDLSKSTFRDADCTGGNFHGANLSAARMEGARLFGASLYGANLSAALLTRTVANGATMYGANLSAAQMDEIQINGANLEGANLSAASLRRASGTNARLLGANLSAAVLSNAVFNNADFQGATLTFARMDRISVEGANFYGATMHAVSMVGANSRGAQFYGAWLTHGADLARANCESANFYGAHLPNATLAHGNFRGADFTGADLRSADLRGADFRTANLRGADLSGANTEGALF